MDTIGTPYSFGYISKYGEINIKCTGNGCQDKPLYIIPSIEVKELFDAELGTAITEPKKGHTYLIDNKKCKCVYVYNDTYFFTNGYKYKYTKQDDEVILTKNRLVKFSDFVKNIEQNKWRIQDIIPESGLTEIYGASGSYKSFIVQDIGFCVASGTEWQGKKVKQGAVLYVAGEAPNGVKKRLKGLSMHYNNLEPDFSILPMPTNLTNDKDIKLLSLEITDLYPDGIAMIIFDTLHRNSAGSNENSAEDWSNILQIIDKYLSPISDNIIWVHHSGTTEQNRSRGTNSRYASVDVSIRVEKKEKLKAKIINDKQKESDEFPPIHFDMKIQDIGMPDENGEEITTLIPVVNTTDTIADTGKGQKKKPLNKEHKDMLGTLRLCIQKSGEAIPSEIKEREHIIDGRCISVNDWKPEALKVLTSTGDDDAKKQQDAKNKKFARYKNILIENHKIVEFDNLVLIVDDCNYKYSKDTWTDTDI
jgi:hypothetical protein